MGGTEPAGASHNSNQSICVLRFVQYYGSRKARNPTTSSALEATLGEKFIPTFRNEKNPYLNLQFEKFIGIGDIGNSIEKRMEDAPEYSL
jgi:hypothetical protein